MKQIFILLSATSLALTPFVSNAKKPVNISEYEVEVLTCSCASELLADDEIEAVAALEELILNDFNMSDVE